MTTRIACTFSCTESFSASYLRNTRRKIGMALRMTSARPTLSSGIVTRKISASRPPMTNPMTNEKISISGPRIATRMIIMKDICTLKMSVVMRVTRLETENLSMFSNE